MKKFKVIGRVQVAVYKEVWANNEDEAYARAAEQFSCLWDKLIGVEEDGESVDTESNEIEYTDIELLEDDPNYMECPDCHEELEEQLDDYGNRTGWFCPECTNWFDDDGEMISPNGEDE